MNVMDAPARPGSYLLLMALDQPEIIRVGRLGMYPFPAGVYVYTGSAFGPGGVAARLRRHVSPTNGQPCHWHVDYLRRAAVMLDAHWVEAAACECEWAHALYRLGGQVTAPGFGSSDCRSGCPAHLLFFAEEQAARAAIRAAAPCSLARE